MFVAAARINGPRANCVARMDPQYRLELRREVLVELARLEIVRAFDRGPRWNPDTGPFHGPIGIDRLAFEFAAVERRGGLGIVDRELDRVPLHAALDGAGAKRSGHGLTRGLQRQTHEVRAELLVDRHHPLAGHG